MTSKISFFDHFMNKVDEAIIPTTPRSWVLDKYGKCNFSMSIIDNPKCTLKNLQFGNLIHIEHLPSEDTDKGTGKLPDWVGIILPPRDWELDVVHCTAYGAESIMAFFAMPYIDVTGTPAVIFNKIMSLIGSLPVEGGDLFNTENTVKPNIKIKPGIVDDVSLTLSDSFRTNAYDHINKIIKGSNMHWNITGEIENDVLKLKANLMTSVGVLTGKELNEINSEVPGGTLLSEQGTITNYVVTYSQAQTESSRFYAATSNFKSIEKFGMFQLNQVAIGSNDKTSVANVSFSRSDDRGFPKKIVKRTALNSGDLLSHIKVGNIIDINETRVGFTEISGGNEGATDTKFGYFGHAKIISVDYNDLTDKCPLNIEILR